MNGNENRGRGRGLHTGAPPRVAGRIERSGADPVAPTKPGTAYFFHQDHLQSTSVLTTETGAVHESLEYFVDGETWINRGPQKPVNGYLFSGKPFDPETGFYDFGQRFYDPRTSLWLGVDPAFAQDGSAPLIGRPFVGAVSAYAAWSPVRFIDPDGRDAADGIEGCDARCQYIRKHANAIPSDLPSIRAVVIDGSGESNDRARANVAAGVVGVTVVCAPCAKALAIFAITQASNEGEAMAAAVGGWLSRLFGRATPRPNLRAVPNQGVGAMKRLEYEGASYHRPWQSGAKNRAPGPARAQETLDMSLQISPTSARRIGIDRQTRESVIFDQTLNNKFHGHVREWHELSNSQRSFVQKEFGVSPRGKVPDDW